MSKESVKPVEILTREVLSSYERELKNSVRAKAMYESDHILIEEIIESHRVLFVANAELSFKNQKLTEENSKSLTKEDILYTLSSISTALEENEKLRKALTDVWEVDTSDWEEAVRKQYSIIEKALEELK